jgi:hypothetical protein
VWGLEPLKILGSLWQMTCRNTHFTPAMSMCHNAAAAAAAAAAVLLF